MKVAAVHPFENQSTYEATYWHEGYASRDEESKRRISICKRLGS